MVWVLAFVFLVIGEIVYLIRHPRTFSGLALFVFLVICGIGGLFLYRGGPSWWVGVTLAVAVFSYYRIKLHR